MAHGFVSLCGRQVHAETAIYKHRDGGNAAFKGAAVLERDSLTFGVSHYLLMELRCPEGGQEYREEAKWRVMLVYGGWGGS